MNRKFIEALRELEKEKGIKIEAIIDALKVAFVSVYKKNYNEDYQIRVDIDIKTGEIKIFRILEEDEKSGEIKDEVEVTPDNFGRIAAQTAKQVMKQRIKEAEREVMYEEFKDRVGDMVTGIVQQNDTRFTLVDLGRVESLLPQYEQVPGERYKHGERIKCYVSDVRKTTKGPQVIVSRTHRGLVKRLFELEVPEIYEEIVEIKSIAREAGYRTKIAVISNDKNVDPVGACVGPKGSRVKMIVGELGGEKIDIVNYSEDPIEFIKNSLSPAKVLKVLTDEERKFALVVVPDEKLSLAIGRDGQNARLAAKLTGWKIDIKSKKQFEEELDEARRERVEEQDKSEVTEAKEKKKKQKKQKEQKKEEKKEVKKKKSVKEIKEKKEEKEKKDKKGKKSASKKKKKSKNISEKT
ncbi:MAG: transcription termination/antitermination protein NusA [Actinobacteria bacterium]|nr:transcription termination/antitermination protein NusA [Actinomycetota bacterium]